MTPFARKASWLAQLILIFTPLSGAAAQSFVRSQLGPALDRPAFMVEGRSGTVALVTGSSVGSQAAAALGNSFRPVRNGECYSIVDNRILSGTGRLYFAVNHNVQNAPAKNSFLAIQVIRFTAGNASSDVAVSRSPGPWISLSSKKAARPVGEGPFLGRTPEEFANAHHLRGGAFDGSAIKSFFSGTTDRSVEWHARLAKHGYGNEGSFYSSQDPELASTWSGTIDQYVPPADRSYQRLVRSYLISLDYGSQDSIPIVFNTDRLGSDFIVIRVSSAPGSGFNLDQTFSLALNGQDCLFVQSAGFHLSRWLWFGR